MTPFYTSDRVTLYHGDVRESEPTGARLVLADPPYNQTGLAWDRWPKGWPDAVAAIVHRAGSMFCFGNLKMFMARKDEFTAWRYAQERVWEKANGSGPCTRDRFNQVHESHVHFTRRGALWRDVYRDGSALRVARTGRSNGRNMRRGGVVDAPHRAGYRSAASTYEDDGTRQMRTVQRHRAVRFRGVNPTEKPVPFILPAARYACPPGGTVLVPFAGSGAEVEAALRAGCHVIAFDVREDQCEATARRVERLAAHPLDIFDFIPTPSPDSTGGAAAA